MNFLKSCAAITLALSLGQAAFAQETTAIDEQFPVEPAGEATPAEFTKSTHEDWQIRCSSAKVDNCVLYQLVKNAEGVAVVELTMVKLPEGGQAIAGVTAVTPLGTILNAGFAMQIDANPAKQYPYNWCTPNGCFARFGLDAAGIAAMKAGSKGAVALFSLQNPKQAIQLPLSLKGFTAGFDELPVAVGSNADTGPAPVVDSPVTGQ